MFCVPRDLGATLRMRAPRRPDASPTIAVYNQSGGAAVAAGTAATRDSVDTTLTGAHAAKVTVLTVGSTTGMVVGDEYAAGTRPTDFLRIASVDSATQVTIQHPTLYAYAGGTALQGTYISYALTGAVANVSERHWHADFQWKFSSADQPPLIMRFDISRYAPAYGPPQLTGSPYPTLNDVRMFEPKVTDNLASTFDYEWGLQWAVMELVRDLSGSRDAGSMVHDDDFRELAALKFLAGMAAPTYGENREKTRLMWEGRYQERFRIIVSQMAVDENQNRAIEEHEQGVWMGVAWRA